MDSSRTSVNDLVQAITQYSHIRTLTHTRFTLYTFRTLITQHVTNAYIRITTRTLFTTYLDKSQNNILVIQHTHMTTFTYTMFT